MKKLHVDEARREEDGGCGSGRGGGRGGIHACIKGVSLLLPGERQPLGFINLVLPATWSHARRCTTDRPKKVPSATNSSVHMLEFQNSRF